MDGIPDPAKIQKRIEVSRELMKLAEHPSWSLLVQFHEQEEKSFAERVGRSAVKGEALDPQWLRDNHVRLKTLGAFVKTPDVAAQQLERSLRQMDSLEPNDEGVDL